jgi:hypothetical protein
MMAGESRFAAIGKAEVALRGRALTRGADYFDWLDVLLF